MRRWRRFPTLPRQVLSFAMWSVEQQNKTFDNPITFQRPSARSVNTRACSKECSTCLSEEKILTMDARCECALAYGVTHPLYMCVHEWLHPKHINKYLESLPKEADSCLNDAPKKQTPSRPDRSPCCLLTKDIVRRDTFSKKLGELFPSHADGLGLRYWAVLLLNPLEE